MTDPQYKGLAIIIAGYPKDMDLMLSRNVGLKSRFQVSTSCFSIWTKYISDFFILDV
jgi:hypothetical protein